MKCQMFHRVKRTSAMLGACAGLAFLAGQVVEAPAQNRTDRVSESAAERQQSESFGQPYEREDEASERTRQTYDEYEERSYGEGRRSDDRPSPPSGQFQDDQYDDQFAQGDTQGGRNDGQQGGLGVVLRETNGRGAQVVNVYLDSPAAQAGLRRGDQIVAINGQRITSVRELQSRISQRDPGARVEVVVLRNGRERVFNARLESRQEALGGRRTGQYTQRGSQDSQHRIEARLIAVERQLQQLLSDVRTLRNQVSSSSPQPPRQAMQSDRATQQQYQQESDDSRLDGRQAPAEDRYFEDQQNRERQQPGDDF